jgi:hypothetical protein
MCYLIQKARGVQLYLHLRRDHCSISVHRVNNLCQALLTAAELGDTDMFDCAMDRLVDVFGADVRNAPRFV